MGSMELMELYKNSIEQEIKEVKRVSEECNIIDFGQAQNLKIKECKKNNNLK